jgi:hypothetical protein
MRRLERTVARWVGRIYGRRCIPCEGESIYGRRQEIDRRLLPRGLGVVGPIEDCNVSFIACSFKSGCHYCVEW